MGGHRRPRTVGRGVITGVLGAVLAGALLSGVAVAAPADALPLPAAPGDNSAAGVAPAPGAPQAPGLPALPAAPGLPNPMNTGPALPQLPALPSNPLDPVNGTPQTKDVTDGLGQVGEDQPEPASEPAPEPAVLDGATRIPGTPCSGDVSACVDLTTLQSWLIVDGEVRRGPVPVRVGDELGPTPVGRFRVQWKDIDHVSSELGTPMPYAVFFADGGIGIHEGRQDTDSAGCVKLSHDDAVAWYYALDVGDGVQVVRTSVR